MSHVKGMEGYTDEQLEAMAATSRDATLELTARKAHKNLAGVTFVTIHGDGTTTTERH